MGRWKLLISGDAQTRAVVRTIGMVPFVALGDIVQRIDTQQKEVETTVSICSPINVDVSTLGTFTLKSAKRAQIKVKHARLISFVETPHLFADLQVPQSVTIGDTHEIDLQSVHSTANMVKTAVLDAIHAATRHEMELGSSDSTVWLNTVIRDNVRICRGVDSEILVFQRC